MARPIADYVCDDCAVKNGGEWPRDYVTTQMYGRCDLCREQKVICAVGKWLWPRRITSTD